MQQNGCSASSYFIGRDIFPLRRAAIHSSNEVQHGIQQSDFPVLFPARGAALLLYRAAAASGGAQRRAAGVQPVLLFLRRAAADRIAAGVHFRQLYLRPAHAQPAPQNLADAVRDLQHCNARRVQISELFHFHREQPVRHGAPADRHCHADRHLVLHLPGAQLCDRRVPPRGLAAEKSVFAGAVRLHVPAVDRRADRPLSRCGRADRAARAHCVRFLRGH